MLTIFGSCFGVPCNGFLFWTRTKIEQVIKANFRALERKVNDFTMMGEAFSTVLSVLLAIGAVILVILVGWFVVWKMFLIRFSFIRELVYGNNGNNNKKSKRKGYTPETPLRRSSRIRQKQATK